MNQNFFPWKPLILSGAFLTALTACSSGEGTLDLLPETDAVEIRLSGDIGSLTGSAATRKPIDANHDGFLHVRFARLDQNVDGSYPAYAMTTPLSATRIGGSGQADIEFGDTQYYLTRENSNSTRLVGWYPSGSYTSGEVSFGISLGTEDVMLTQELTGNKNSQFGQSNRIFTFKHLLTKVSVKAYGDADVNETWGKVYSVEVKGQPVRCIVTLPGTAANDISWLGTTNLDLKNSTTDNLMTSVSLSTSTADCGYAMFRPTLGNTLTLIVKTEKGGVREVAVTAPEGSSTFAAGKAYTITLQFKSTTIAPTATISAWTLGGSTDVDL